MLHTARSPFPENRSLIPRDLRGSGPATAGAGKIYPVDPAAVQQLRDYWQQQAEAAAEKQKGATMSSKPKEAVLKDLQARSQANGKTAVPAIRRAKANQAVDPAETYPAGAVRAAQIEAAKDGRRNLRHVLTDEVLAIWHQWNTGGGKSLEWIAEHNGLLELTGSQVWKYLRKYREGLESTPAKTVARPAPPHPQVPIEEPEAETAVPAEDTQPKPEVEPMATAVEPFKAERPENLPTFFDREYRPQRPGPAEAFAALAALAGNEQLRMKGSVKLNLEIEFGE